jgi:hypothetical protein
MKLVILLTLTLGAIGCSLNNTENNVKGERNSKTGLDSIYQLINRQGFEDSEKLMSFTDCRELMDYIAKSDIIIVSQNGNSFKLESSTGNRLDLKFNFDSDDC